MPEGVDVVVADGIATIDFVDPAKKGPGIDALLKAGGPEAVSDPLTRTGPRELFVTDEDTARAAGLLDEPVEGFDWPDTSSATDVSGFVPTPGQSAANLHAQEVRTGAYADAYGGTTVVTEADGSKVEVGQFVQPVTVDAVPFETIQVTPAEYSALSDAGELEPGKVYMVATEVQPGETAEVVGEDTGGPYTDLPVIDNPDGHTELTPALPADGGVIHAPVEMTPPADDVVVVTEPAAEPTEAAGDEQPSAPEPTPSEPEPVAEPVAEPAVEETQEQPVARLYDDGKPDSDWKRPALEQYATKELGFADASPAAYSNREKLLAAINEEIARREAAEQGE